VLRRPLITNDTRFGRMFKRDRKSASFTVNTFLKLSVSMSSNTKRSGSFPCSETNVVVAHSQL
jgi:hypothetical protein